MGGPDHYSGDRRAADRGGTVTEILPDQAVDGERFRKALAGHASGVVVVTARHDGKPVGLTATSFSSVSLTPPLVSFYASRASTTLPGLRAAEHFAVNVLRSDQADIAARFAQKGIDRFAEPTRWHRGRFGAPLLHDASVHLICRRHMTAEIGDHVLVVGLVVEAAADGSGQPLLYHRGRYGRFLPHR